MYLINAADIQIIAEGRQTLRFTRVNYVEIESSAKLLEDTAIVKIPTTARLERAGKFISEVETARQFRVGDQIAINLGYNGQLNEEFYGYISKILPGSPLTIECVDATWLLRRKNMKESFRNVDLGTLLEACVQGTGIQLIGEVPTIRFTHFYMRNVTAASVLQELKDDYGLTMYLKNFNELHVGLRSYTDNKVVTYGFGENIIDNDLEWVNEDDTRIKVKAVHIRKNNTQVTKEYGDADGEQRTLFFYDVDNEADLKQLAEQEVKKYKYTGFKGDFKTLLRPLAEVGNVARIRDKQYEGERDGDYLIDKIVTTFGNDGARRKISLGLKTTV